MTSRPVPRDVTRRYSGIVWWILTVTTLLQSFQTVTGCILLLDGWSPMSVGERATLADIVAVGVVHRTFKSDRSDDGAATYSAEVRIIDVFKGRPLVDTVPYQLDEQRFTSDGTQLQLGNSSGIQAESEKSSSPQKIFFWKFFHFGCLIELNFANLLAVHIHIYLSIFVDKS